MSRSFSTCSGATRLAVRPSYSALRPRCLNDRITLQICSVSLVACQSHREAPDLPEEVAYLQACDRFAHGIQEIADMPAEKIELLHRFLRQEFSDHPQREPSHGAACKDQQRGIDMTFEQDRGHYQRDRHRSCVEAHRMVEIDRGRPADCVYA